MNIFLSLVCLAALIAGAYFLIRLIIAAIRKQDKANYLKKLIASVVVLIAASIGVYQTRTPEQIAAHQAKIEAEKKSAEEKRLADEKAAEEKKIAEQQAAEEKRLAEEKANADKKAQEEAKRQAAEEERRRKQAEFEASEKERKQNEMLKEFSNGWNLETTDTSNDGTNLLKAAGLVKKYPDYIHSAEANWISAEDAMKKPWEYYGKVTNLSGRIYSIKQMPPGSSEYKFFGGNCYEAMLAVGDSYDPIAISMIIVGDSSSIEENSYVNVKGYIYGHAKLVNRLGGGSRGLAFVGFQE